MDVALWTSSTEFEWKMINTSLCNIGCFPGLKRLNLPVFFHLQLNNEHSSLSLSLDRTLNTSSRRQLSLMVTVLTLCYNYWRWQPVIYIFVCIYIYIYIYIYIQWGAKLYNTLMKSRDFLFLDHAELTNFDHI